MRSKTQNLKVIVTLLSRPKNYSWKQAKMDELFLRHLLRVLSFHCASFCYRFECWKQKSIAQFIDKIQISI